MLYKRGLAKLWICKLHAFLLGNCKPAELKKCCKAVLGFLDSFYSKETVCGSFQDNR